MAVQEFSAVTGLDFTLETPVPLVSPPLSLLGEARSLIDLAGMYARRQAALEKIQSGAEQLEAYDRDGVVGDDDQPGEADSLEDTVKALEQQMSEWTREFETWDDGIARMQGWEQAIQYLPELGNAESMSVFAPGTVPPVGSALASGATKQTGSNQEPFYWYDPFVAVGRDSRSLFGWPNTDFASRLQRCQRALLAHESWQAEYEFWTGTQVPTNYHLSASPSTAVVSPHRTIDAWPNPLAPPGTTLGTPESLSDSLAALDQSIANADAGTGMIHASCYLVQKWAQVYPYLRDPSGNIRTVNNNLIVPGYGYPGTGPDQASRSVTDVVTTDGSPDITSASAAFTDLDIGRPINETDAGGHIPAGAVILTVTSPTAAVLSVPATGAATGIDATLPGVGGNATGSVVQWAYATEMVFHLQGDIVSYPSDLREISPALYHNSADIRVERSHALLTNRLLRAAVAVDTSTT